MQLTISGSIFSWGLDISCMQSLVCSAGKSSLLLIQPSSWADGSVTALLCAMPCLDRGCPCRSHVISICLGRIRLTRTWFVIDDGAVLVLEIHMSLATCHDIMRVQGATWILGLWGCFQCLNICNIIWAYRLDKRRIYKTVSFFQWFSYLFRYTEKVTAFSKICDANVKALQQIFQKLELNLECCIQGMVDKHKKIEEEHGRCTKQVLQLDTKLYAMPCSARCCWHKCTSL